jgi:hypothetical protein
MKIGTTIIAALGAGSIGAMFAFAAPPTKTGFDVDLAHNAQTMLDEGKKTFRFETFGSESFWGDALQLHKAIAGEKNGGVGLGVSPKTALSVGLKVDADALPAALKKQLAAGKVNLDDPATTTAVSDRWGSNARFAIRRSTTRSRPESASGSTVGPTAILTSAQSYRSHPTLNPSPISSASMSKP